MTDTTVISQEFVSNKEPSESYTMCKNSEEEEEEETLEGKENSIKNKESVPETRKNKEPERKTKVNGGKYPRDVLLEVPLLHQHRLRLIQIKKNFICKCCGEVKKVNKEDKEDNRIFCCTKCKNVFFCESCFKGKTKESEKDNISETSMEKNMGGNKQKEKEEIISTTTDKESETSNDEEGDDDMPVKECPKLHPHPMIKLTPKKTEICQICDIVIKRLEARYICNSCEDVFCQKCFEKELAKYAKILERKGGKKPNIEDVKNKAIEKGKGGLDTVKDLKGKVEGFCGGGCDIF